MGRKINYLASFVLLLLALIPDDVAGFRVNRLPVARPSISRLGRLRKIPSSVALSMAPPDAEDKFGFAQRIESVKCLVVGALVGGIALAPFSAAHDLLFLDPSLVTSNGLAQWEFDTDMGALLGGLFAIVYRYCVRMDDNPQLGQGVVGAFVLTRTLGGIVVPSYCSTIPLNCGAPLSYLDWNMLFQIAIRGTESAVLFGATAFAMEYLMQQGTIKKFP